MTVCLKGSQSETQLVKHAIQIDGRCFHSIAIAILSVDNAVIIGSSMKCLPTPTKRGISSVIAPANFQCTLSR